MSVSIQPALGVAIPVTIVAKVYLMIHVCITFRVVDGIIAKVPSSAIVDLLLVRNQTIDFLDISLEVAVVLECLVLCHDRLGVLVEPVGASSKG